MKILIVGDTKESAQQYEFFCKFDNTDVTCMPYEEAIDLGVQQFQEYGQVLLVDKANGKCITIAEALEHLGYELWQQQAVAGYIYNRPN